MTSDAHNGYSNRETWAVALRLNNEQAWQDIVHTALRESIGEVVMTTDGYADQDVALKGWQAGDIVRECLEAIVDGMVEYGDAGQVRMLLEDIGSLWRVDWSELGALFLADATEIDNA